MRKNHKWPLSMMEVGDVAVIRGFAPGGVKHRVYLYTYTNGGKFEVVAAEDAMIVRRLNPDGTNPRRRPYSIVFEMDGTKKPGHDAARWAQQLAQRDLQRARDERPM